MRWRELLRRRSAFKRLVRDLSPDVALTLVDVGSVGWLKNPIGARALLCSDLLLAEIEVSFIGRYIAQPLYWDVAAFIRSHG